MTQRKVVPNTNLCLIDIRLSNKFKVLLSNIICLYPFKKFPANKMSNNKSCCCNIFLEVASESMVLPHLEVDVCEKVLSDSAL